MLIESCCVQQIYTNATVAAGLVDDGRTLLTGLNDILGELLEQSLPKQSSE